MSVEIRNAQTECDIVLLDINKALSGQWRLRGKGTAITDLFGPVCGMTLDTSSLGSGILKLNYDGSTCNGRKREGRVTLTIINYPLTKLKSYAGVVQVDFNGYNVTRTLYGNSLQLDGTAYLVNENGGTWYELMFLNQPSLVESLTADNLLATINGNSAVYYNLSRRYEYTYRDSIIRCTETGIDIKTGQENYGYTSTKKKFTSYILSPVKWTSVCGPQYPVSGQVFINVDELRHQFNSNYGIDSEGNAMTTEGANCAYGFKTSWSYKRKTHDRVFEYNN